jgi:hypothetical protein
MSLSNQITFQFSNSLLYILNWLQVIVSPHPTLINTHINLMRFEIYSLWGAVYGIVGNFIFGN